MVAINHLIFTNYLLYNSKLFLACRHTKKAGVVESYESHIAPITAIDTHCAVGNTDFSHLFLTSSIDWTIKLWNIKVKYYFIFIYIFLCFKNY